MQPLADSAATIDQHSLIRGHYWPGPPVPCMLPHDPGPRVSGLHQNDVQLVLDSHYGTSYSEYLAWNNPLPVSPDPTRGLVMVEHPSSTEPSHGTFVTSPIPADVISSPLVDLKSNSESDFASNEPLTDAPAFPLLYVSNGKWECGICNKAFRRKGIATMHFRSTHRGEHIHCEGICGNMGCNKRFTTQEGLRVHAYPPSGSCSICGKSMKRKNLTRHKRTVHSNSKVFAV